MKSKLEARIDAELGVEVYVYHFHDHSRREGGNPHRIWAFGGITIATPNMGRTFVEDIVLEEQRVCGIYHNAASDMLKGLHASDIHGVAICDWRDQFSRKRGRVIAKGRLLKYLKECRGE
jgi:hypothetical protein